MASLQRFLLACSILLMVTPTDNRAAVQFGSGLVSKIGLYVLAWVSKKADLIAYSISEVEAWLKSSPSAASAAHVATSCSLDSTSSKVIIDDSN